MSIIPIVMQNKNASHHQQSMLTTKQIHVAYITFKWDVTSAAPELLFSCQKQNPIQQ